MAIEISSLAQVSRDEDRTKLMAWYIYIYIIIDTVIYLFMFTYIFGFVY
jgi:hypothetical protein